MILKNVRIFRENGIFEPGELYTVGMWIANTSRDGQVLDGQGAYAIPGLTDLHFHGCMGYDFCDGTPEAFAAIATYELQNGITQICPATMTGLHRKGSPFFCSGAKSCSGQSAEHTG